MENEHLESRVERQRKSAKKKHPRKKLIITIILSILGLGIVLGGAYAAYVYNMAHKAVNQTYSSTGSGNERANAALLNSKKPFAVLLLGTDTGTNGNFGSNRDRSGLTDSIMLVIVNPEKKATTIVSIPRDIMTSIPGFESSFPQKLNAAYAFKETADSNASLGDGVGTTMKTIEKMFNVPINYYAMVNMSGLGQVVDQLDGIKVASPLTFTFSQDTAEQYGNNLYHFTKGSTTFKYAEDGSNFSTYTSMNGTAALAFSRMRYEDPLGDYGRTLRQRLILQAIIDKAKSNPTKVLNAKFFNTAAKNIATDLTWNDLLTIGSSYLSASDKITSYTVQGESQMYNGVSYQRLTTNQRQAMTNTVRSALGLKSAETGHEFSSTVSSSDIYSVGLADDLYPSSNTKANLKLNNGN
ncbi:transcriptional regulator [Weissella oryzae SG25]|uniref:Transcriptional regulator n=1 Tax=Weissella oryzae (strain DSM 25784 / JCM 18191 / LMG 30913 / SG25) TaxID=1329250 RepID=A0A069CX69_WEIOS|nr:LCP family protein [Weissella oryzae]GAK31773.1 transcriptional regulator [Weissella oryzae SG25]